MSYYTNDTTIAIGFLMFALGGLFFGAVSCNGGRNEGIRAALNITMPCRDDSPLKTVYIQNDDWVCLKGYWEKI